MKKIVIAFVFVMIFSCGGGKHDDCVLDCQDQCEPGTCEPNASLFCEQACSKVKDNQIEE